MRNPESIIKDRVRAAFIGTPIILWNHPTGVAIPVEALRGLVDVSRLPRVAYGLEGSSDLVGILPGGRFLGIETKTPNGRQREAQVRFQAMVERQGGLYVVARSAEEAKEKVLSWTNQL